MYANEWLITTAEWPATFNNRTITHTHVYVGETGDKSPF